MNKIIQIGHYPFDLMLSFAETDEQFKKTLKRFGIKDFEDPACKLAVEMEANKNADGRYLMFRGKQSVIRLLRMPDIKNPIDMSLLNHELMHAIQYFCSEILMCSLTEDTGEIYAYLMQDLTEKVYKLL